MFSPIIDFFLSITESLGHWGVFILMTVESSFIPFPSEIVIPPAAYLAHEGKLNIYIVILAGILGSIAGALINYYLAKYLGRPLVYKLLEQKWTRYLLLNREKLERAEKHFEQYGDISTFIGRLIPVVRQLISLPAGFVKMNLSHFLFFTSIGSGIWVVILAVLGYQFGAQQEVLQKYYSELGMIGIGLGLIVFGLLIASKIKKRSKSAL